MEEQPAAKVGENVMETSHGPHWLEQDTGRNNRL